LISRVIVMCLDKRSGALRCCDLRIYFLGCDPLWHYRARYRLKEHAACIVAVAVSVGEHTVVSAERMQGRSTGRTKGEKEYVLEERGFTAQRCSVTFCEGLLCLISSLHLATRYTQPTIGGCFQGCSAIKLTIHLNVRPR
jgi:hypothetical protein